jgi:hypothetical protein
VGVLLSSADAHGALMALCVLFGLGLMPLPERLAKAVHGRICVAISA